MAPLQKPATLTELERLPETVKGEIIEGVLYALPRPRARHQSVTTAIAAALHGPYQGGRGGPGGWWILVEPGIGLPGSPEFSPDVAGWQRERLPELPERRIEVVPDWVCEVLSPSNRKLDLSVKRPFYARIGVRWLWYVDLEGRTVYTHELVNGRWTDSGVFVGDETLRAPPFIDVEIAIGEWWGPAAVGMG